MEVENTITEGGIAGGNIEMDARAGMIGRVVQGCAQTARPAISGGGDEVCQWRGRRAVEVRKGGTIAGAEAEISHARVVPWGISWARLLCRKHTGLHRSEIPGKVHDGFEVISSVRDAGGIDAEPVEIIRFVENIIGHNEDVIRLVLASVLVGQPKR